MFDGRDKVTTRAGNVLKISQLNAHRLSLFPLGWQISLSMGFCKTPLHHFFHLSKERAIQRKNLFDQREREKEKEKERERKRKRVSVSVRENEVTYAKSFYSKKVQYHVVCEAKLTFQSRRFSCQHTSHSLTLWYFSPTPNNHHSDLWREEEKNRGKKEERRGRKKLKK